MLINNLLSKAVELRPVLDEKSKIAFSIGNLSIMWYAVIIMFGAVLVAIYGYYRFGKRMKVTGDDVLTGFTLGLIFGILGARLYYVVFTASSGEIQYTSLFQIINPRDGGLAIHGAIIAEAIYLPIFCKIKKIDLLTLLEITMPLILFAQVVGRWGNFMNQEAFGSLVQVDLLKEAGELTRTTVLSDEILIAQREALSRLLVPDFIINRMYISLASDGASTSGFVCAGYYYPTFYFESVLNLIGIIAYMILRKKWKKILVGDGISFYLIWYGIVRLFIETLRTDPLYLGTTGIKVAILTSVLYIVLGVAWVIIHRIKKIKMVSCYDALYGENATLVLEGYGESNAKNKK